MIFEVLLSIIAYVSVLYVMFYIIYKFISLGSDKEFMDSIVLILSVGVCGYILLLPLYNLYKYGAFVWLM